MIYRQSQLLAKKISGHENVLFRRQSRILLDNLNLNLDLNIKFPSPLAKSPLTALTRISRLRMKKASRQETIDSGWPLYILKMYTYMNKWRTGKAENFLCNFSRAFPRRLSLASAKRTKRTRRTQEQETPQNGANDEDLKSLEFLVWAIEWLKLIWRVFVAVKDIQGRVHCTVRIIVAGVKSNSIITIIHDEFKPIWRHFCADAGKTKEHNERKQETANFLTNLKTF